MKLDNIQITRKYDKRIHLTPDHKKSIRALYAQGNSIRSIAREYMNICSRRMIQFILFPGRLKHNAALYKERRKDNRYYIRAKHTKAMQIHRAYKRQLIGENKICPSVKIVIKK